MKHIFLLFIAVIIATTTDAQEWKKFDFQDGDILFQDLDCGALCNAIETVTPSWHGRHFSHAGIVYKRADSVYVIEAIGNDVHSTPVAIFMQRQADSVGNPKVVVGRLKKKYRKLNKQAVDFALAQSGKLYDKVFLCDNDKYYCTELVYDAYKHANGGKAFFQLHPMTFKEPSTSRTFPAWEDYYKELATAIPEGKPGCNPGSVATDKKIRIVRKFY